MAIVSIQFRVMTYNVHSCIGTDGHLSLLRVAGVIAEHQPDIVCLQELDVGKARSRHVDQAHALAERLKMSFHYHPAIAVAEERYGDAILSPHPMRLVHAAVLPTVRAPRVLPRRGALWAAITIGGREIQVINTHLGINERERLAQARALLGPDWAGHPACRPPVVLCGDLNAIPASPGYHRFRRLFRDAHRLGATPRPRRTYPSRIPLIRIDHIFISPELDVDAVQVPRSRLTRLASDHLPLIADLAL